MKRILIYIFFFLTTLFDCDGQNFFNFTDTVFEVGQVKRVAITYRLSGGGHPTIESISTLDSVVDFLNNNANLMIEIIVHSDYRDETKMNERLSEMRARRIKEYIVEKGIDSNRLQHNGMGESDPVMVDSLIFQQFPFLDLGQKLTDNYIKTLDTIDKQEIANRLNRRTEFIIKKN
jgi:outer membrane protein OmpA-like peptidoglycan-associated protein